MRGYPEQQIIRIWYKKLRFPGNYDEEFERILADPNITKKEDFTDNAVENLLTALYQCEVLEQQYVRLGIDPQILLDTLSDVVIWTQVWHDLTGQLGLMETDWIKHHFSFRLFRLGRLQFCMNGAEYDLADHGIRKGMPVVEVHIPAGSPLECEMCKESFKRACSFFDKYFPEYKYEYFTCHSWLLDQTLKRFLVNSSNILSFQELFSIIHAEQSDAILKYMFRWDAVRDNIARYHATSMLAERIKEYVLQGNALYEAYGVIRKEEVFLWQK